VPYVLATLDPHVESSLGSALLYNSYESLLDLDADLRPRPGLAESWSTPGERTWIFRLRKNVRFHDGSPLRAADAAYTLKRVLANRRYEAGYYLTDVESVRDLDEHTLEITTIRPTALLATRLAFVPVVRDGVPSSALAGAVNGTGPYRLEAHTPEGELRFVRHDGYWGRPSVVEKASVFSGVQADAATESLLAGRLDVADFGGRLPADELKARPDLVAYEGSGLYVTMLAFDLDDRPKGRGRERAPLRDPRVRRAIDLALDRTRLEGGPADTPASQFVPPAVLGFDPELRATTPDRGRARELLREAGYPSGFAETLHARPPVEVVAREVSRQLEEIGVNLEVEVLTPADYARRIEGGSRVWVNRWPCATGDAGELFENAFHSFDPQARLGLFNRGAGSDPELDRAIRDSASIGQPMERRRSLQALMRRTVEELRWVPLTVQDHAFVARRGLAFRPRLSGAIRLAEIPPR
jgi:peptide/nickel transport system substrate-binding protein